MPTRQLQSYDHIGTRDSSFMLVRNFFASFEFLLYFKRKLKMSQKINTNNPKLIIITMAIIQPVLIS